MSLPYHCQFCPDGEGRDPRWRVERRGDAALSWACDAHLAGVCETMQRSWEATELVVVEVGRVAAAADGGALTDVEHEAMDLSARLWNALCRIVGTGPSRAGDLAELVAHVHAIQQAILSQAAGRAYPGRYRLLGSTLRDKET